MRCLQNIFSASHLLCSPLIQLLSCLCLCLPVSVCAGVVQRVVALFPLPLELTHLQAGVPQ